PPPGAVTGPVQSERSFWGALLVAPVLAFGFRRAATSRSAHVIRHAVASGGSALSNTVRRFAAARKWKLPVSGTGRTWKMGVGGGSRGGLKVGWSGRGGLRSGMRSGLHTSTGRKELQGKRLDRLPGEAVRIRPQPREDRRSSPTVFTRVVRDVLEGVDPDDFPRQVRALEQARIGLLDQIERLQTQTGRGILTEDGLPVETEIELLRRGIGEIQRAISALQVKL
ncbi:MAG: hypothetical protein HY539_05460, partial [Deltaproteobacteria bacterium]|nr:hypothetical protein [Deltaproteobacteria bacterium]